MTSILHVASSIRKSDGGTVTALLGMAAAQAAAGLKVAVVTTQRVAGESTVEDELREAGVEVQILLNATGPLRRHPELRPTLERVIKDADVVHVHAMWEQPQHDACRVAYSTGTPVVISPHGMLDPWSLSQSRCKKRLYLAARARKNLQRAAAIHFTTPTERQLASSFCSTRQAVIEPLGVDVEALRIPCKPGLDLRTRYGLGPGPILLYFGRLHPKKQPEILIEAFARVQKAAAGSKGKAAALVLVGPSESNYLERLCSLVNGLGVRDACIFAGSMAGDERVAALQSADLFCLPSQQENFGLAVAEALAAGTPVLISDQVNIFREIVDAGVGWATPPTLDPYADQLLELCSDPGAMVKAGDRAAEFAAIAYSWPAIASRWIKRYEDLATDKHFDNQEADR